MNWEQNDKAMDKQQITSLLTKYNAGIVTEEEKVIIEQLLEKGLIDLDDLQDVRDLNETLQRFEYPSPSPDLDVTFYQMLRKEQKSSAGFSFRNWFNVSGLAPGLAFAAATFLLGLAAGYVLFQQSPGDGSDIQALSNEVNDLKEMMMLSLLEKESATERLRAVNLTQEMPAASQSVTKALITTLNSDENVNVRLAALEALIPYTQDSNVRTELIKSIGKQHSPLLQIALADLMVALQEKESVKEFEKLLENERTPEDVKKRIREKMEIII